MYSPVNWGCKIHQLHLCRGLRPSPPTSVLHMTLNNLLPRLQPMRFGEYRKPLQLLMLSGLLSPGVVAPDRVLSMGQIEQTMIHFDCYIAIHETT